MGGIHWHDIRAGRAGFLSRRARDLAAVAATAVATLLPAVPAAATLLPAIALLPAVSEGQMTARPVSKS